MYNWQFSGCLKLCRVRELEQLCKLFQQQLEHVTDENQLLQRKMEHSADEVDKVKRVSILSHAEINLPVSGVVCSGNALVSIVKLLYTGLG